MRIWDQTRRRFYKNKSQCQLDWITLEYQLTRHPVISPSYVRFCQERICETLCRKSEELPEWAILLPSVQDIQDWRPKWINRIFGNQDWKETRWDTRMNSANPDIANFEKSQARRRGAQRRTKHPNNKYHHWREEVRKGIINISTYHTGTKWQKADKPFSDLLTNVWRKKMMKDWD